jgi:P4 family phage/plasmid primase-like protien
MHSYALATTPEVDRRLLQGLGDVLADDRQITEGRNDFGQIVAGRTEETIPVPETLVTALSQTLESRIMGGGSRHPIQIQTVERISLDVLQRLEGAGTRLVAPDEDRGHTLLQFLHLQHLLRLAHAAGTHVPPAPADDGTVQARVATPEESVRRELYESLQDGLIGAARGQIQRGVADEEIILTLVRYPRGEFLWELPLGETIVSAHREIADEAQRSSVTRDPQGWRYRLTPAALAEEFVTVYRNEIRYVGETKVWRYWDRVVWADDLDAVRATALAKSLILQNSNALAASLDSETMRKVAERKISPLLTPNGLKNILALAAKDNRIRTSTDDYDRDPYLLNLLNGTLDLRTGQLRLHSREDLITRLAGVVDGEDLGLRYDPSARCPLWEKCVDEWFVTDPITMRPDHATIRAVQERGGYWLSGLTREAEYVTWYGPTGRNGKGVFKNILLMIAGQYGATGEIGTFVKRGRSAQGAARGDLAALPGRRLVVVNEPDDKDMLDEGFVKAITGGDRLSYRAPYGKQNVDFQPAFKLLILANHPPRIAGADSIWDRQKIVLWLRRFDDAHQNRDLEGELRPELPGILNWLVDGFRAYYTRGRLSESPAMRGAKERYAASQTPHWVEFVEDACVLRSEVPPRYRERIQIHKGTLYDAYTRWCQGEGIATREMIGRNRFYSMLINRYALGEVRIREVGRGITGITTREHYHNLLTPEDRRVVVDHHMDYAVLLA